VARKPAERPQPSDRDRRSRVDPGGSKPPREPFSRNPSSFSLRSPVFPPFTHASEGGRRRPAARSERCHGGPHRRRARSPQGERAAVERLHLWRLDLQRGERLMSGQRLAQPPSTRGRGPRGIRSRRRRPGRVDGGRPKGKPGKSPCTTPFCCELGLGLGFAGLTRGACVLSPRKGSIFLFLLTFDLIQNPLLLIAVQDSYPSLTTLS
jgi:hypothetical protein